MNSWPENSRAVEHINTGAIPENSRTVEHTNTGAFPENSRAVDHINTGEYLELSKAVVPKVRSADTERFATNSQGISGYISVLTVFIAI